MTKYILVLFLLSSFSLYSLSRLAQNSTNIKIVDEDNNPIYGVYVHINNQFYYSNDSGIVTIISRKYSDQDSISFSHINYVGQCLKINDLLSSIHNPTIHLHSNISILEEITVTSDSRFNEAEFVKDAISLLNTNYEKTFYSKTLELNTSINIVCSSEQKDIIQFKGILTLAQDEKNNTLVSKKIENEYVANNAKDYFFFIPPYNFTSIISIHSQPCIRKNEEFVFNGHEFITYNGLKCVKIYFNINKQIGKQNGYLIANLQDKAILALDYTIAPIKNYIGGIKNGKMVKTSIIKYEVFADYTKISSGKYVFNSGIEKIQLSNSIGKKEINTT